MDDVGQGPAYTCVMFNCRVNNGRQTQTHRIDGLFFPGTKKGSMDMRALLSRS
jgi:hypothetical protein